VYCLPKCLAMLGSLCKIQGVCKELLPENYYMSNFDSIICHYLILLILNVCLTYFVPSKIEGFLFLGFYVFLTVLLYNFFINIYYYY